MLQLHLPERWPDLTTAEEPVFRWTRYEGGQVARDLSPLREIPPARTVIAVAPASRILFVRARLPNARAAKQEKVLAFLVEDAIGSSPEEIHAMVAGEAIDRSAVIAVVDRSWLRGAYGELEMQGYAPTRLVSEGELLAPGRDPDRRIWTVVCTRHGGFLHLGGVEHLVLETMCKPDDGPPMALDLALDEHTRAGTSPDAIEVMVAPGMPEPDLARWAQKLAIPVRRGPDWQPEMLDARSCAKTNLLTVLPGVRSGESAEWKRYRAAAVLAGAIVIAHGVLTTVDWWRMRSEASAIRTAMEARFRKVFPDAKAVVDPVLQMNRQLARLRGDSGEVDPGDFIALLGKVAPALAASSARATTMKYERGQLLLEVILPGDETRESLEAKLGGGVRVQVERVEPAASGGAQASVKVSAS